MNTFIITAGIYISAKIISFIAGELTEVELRKQEEINSEIDRINALTHAGNPSDASEQTDNESQEVTKHTAIYNYLCSQATTRESDNSILYNEIRELKKHVIEVLNAKDNIHTPLRKHSLELLYRQLCEAQEKCHSYQIYLKVYKERIKFIKCGNNIPVFWMKLPPSYPYVGNVLWFNTDQITQHHTIVHQLSSSFQVTIDITDTSEYELAKHQNFPVMITYSGKTYAASIEKGLFKSNELGNTHLGLTATVKQIYRNRIILIYHKNLELCLPRDNLINRYRFPPIRSTVTVYPVNWDYCLATTFTNKSGKTNYPVIVSEKKESANSSFSFQNFPICFTDDNFSLFSEYYKTNNLQNYNEEFLIGPVNENKIRLQKGTQVKLQLGDLPLCILTVDENSDNVDQSRFYLRFDRLCDPSEKTFSADDIFLPFDVSITPYYDGTTNNTLQECTGISNLDDISAIIWDIFEEFRIQDRIKKDRVGIGYFFKWENITNQLINVLEQSEPFLLKVRWMPAEKRNRVAAEVLNSAELRVFIQNFARKTDMQLLHEWQPEFFIKDEQGNHYDTDINDYGHQIIIKGRNVLELFHDKAEQIELFASNQPYAEYQQKKALRQFRIGQVINPKIQAACLNGSSILSNISNDYDLVPFHNKQLNSNPTQCAAVERGFKEKDIFLIQGPPGSGKTTVIREIIEQVFATRSDARVLVVSQANVAVDTALDEMVDQYGDQIVRCGNGNKISPKLQKMRLQNRCQDYLDALHQRKETFEQSFYDSWESTILSTETYAFSPVLCELIIRSHRLIGATCVGLAKRNIGLERAEFDLVIIDEAGKALPAELLIPLIRAKKAIIIGDQKQLPPRH